MSNKAYHLKVEDPIVQTFNEVLVLIRNNEIEIADLKKTANNLTKRIEQLEKKN